MQANQVTLIPAARPSAIVCATLCGAAAFGLYLATLAPTVGAGDSAELALAAGRGGIPHPPGYPLWVMAAWLFVRLPGLELLGDLAWRANLLSALLTALAVGAAAGLALRLRLTGPGALLAAGIVAVAPTVWAEATRAEVHALNLLLLVLAGHAWRSAVRSPAPRSALWLGLMLMLVLTYHPVNLGLLPLAVAALVPVVRHDRRHPGPVLLGAVVGLLPLLWLPLRALTAPELDAFGAARPDRLWAGWSREIFGPLRQHGEMSPARLAGQISAGLGLVGATLGWIGLVLASFGLEPLLRRRRLTVAVAGGTLMLVVFGPWLVLNATPDAAHRLSVEPAQVAGVLLLALLAGRGFDRLQALFRAALLPGSRALRGIAPALASGVVALLLVLQGLPQFERQDRRDDRIARWYGEDLLQSVAPGATLFLDGDNELFLTAYLQTVDGRRPDVRLVHRRGYLVADPFGFRGRPRSAVTRDRDLREAEFVDRADAPVYFVARPEWAAGRDVALRREGLAWRVARTADAARDRGPAPDPWPRFHAGVWEIAPASLDFLHRKCLVGYYEARADRLQASGDAEAARAAWLMAARVGFDFPERPALLAALGVTDAEARP